MGSQLHEIRPLTAKVLPLRLRPQVQALPRRAGLTRYIAVICLLGLVLASAFCGTCRAAGDVMRNKSVRFSDGIRVAVAVFGSLFSMSNPAAAGTFITFDPPNSIFTSVGDINNKGDVVGFYHAPTGVVFAFERQADGTIVTFGINRAATTVADGINDKGQIAGASVRQSGEPHCFLKKKPTRNRVLSCDPASAIFAQGFAINGNTMISGSFSDGVNTHGFIWEEDGATGFDAPGAIRTSAVSINDSGVSTGTWADADQTVHGFVRATDGSITEFDVAGAIFTQPNAINASGTIAGGFRPGGDREGVPHPPGEGATNSFVRDPAGNITVFDPPRAQTSSAQDLNDKGVVVGRWTDTSGVRHGYQRRNNGHITSLDVPGATGTFADVINENGQIAGIFFSADGSSHGYLFNP
jgi:uncharacterized membrane protein